MIIIDIAHEALIRHWPRLREWLKDDPEFKAWQDGFLRPEVRKWLENNENTGWLLRDERLVEAEKWLKKRADKLTDNNTKFIKASIILREHENKEREAARQKLDVSEQQKKQTQRRFTRLKKVLGVISLLVLLSLIFIHQFFYYFAISRDGFVEVRHGIRELGPFSWPRVETDIDATLLPEEQLTLLRDGKMIGFWHGYGKNKIRLWGYHILPRLDEQQRQFSHLLMTKRLDKNAFIENTDISIQAWRTKLFADSFFLDRTWETNKRLNGLWKNLPKLDKKIDCGRNISNYKDFNLLNLSSDDIVTYLSALESYVLSGLADLETTVDYAIRLLGYRLWYIEDQENMIIEFKAFQKLLQAVQQKQKKALDEKWWSVNDEGWCDLSKLAVLSQLGNSDTQAIVQQQLIEVINTLNVTERGDLLSLGQKMTLLILEEMAGEGNLSSQAIMTVFKIIEADERRLDGNPGLIEWINNIAAYQELPEEVKKYLFEELYRPPEEYDFYPLTAFKILARNAMHLSHNEKERLLLRLPWLIKTFKGMHTLTESLGYLGCVGLSRPSDITYLDEQMKPDIRVSLFNGRALGTVIEVTDFEIGVALGRIAQHSKLPQKVYDRLLSFAINRFNNNITHIEQLYKGLAVQRSYSQEKALIKAIRKRLIAASTKTLARHVEIKIAIAQIMSLTDRRRQEVVEQLRHDFEHETEPENKMALATILIETEKRIADRGCY
ncbi:MAG: hypothetical protein VSS75_005190 [Candidatus Parabeggiatoa sp.]|nr:hypothetical protein [Candidatus Parabeggiatoa sp.]